MGIPQHSRTRHTHQKPRQIKSFRIMGEAIDGCTAFNLALCVAIAWGIPEYFSAAWFAKITIPHFALIQSSFLVYCMHPKFNGASQFAGQFLGPVLNLVQQHLWAVLLAIDHFYGGYWGDNFYCKFTFYYAVYNTLKGSNKNWLLFWVFYHLVKEYNDCLAEHAPYFDCAKKVFLVWCWHECFNGASVVYDFAIKPWFPVVEATVNKIVAPVVNCVNNAVEKKND